MAIMSIFLPMTVLHAQNTIEIIPELTESERDEIAEAHTRIMDVSGSGSVWDRYRQEAKNLSDTPDQQVVSGIMTWDTILDYAQKVLIFLAQAGLAIGAIMIIRVGYSYIMSIINGESPQQ